MPQSSHLTQDKQSLAAMNNWQEFIVQENWSTMMNNDHLFETVIAYAIKTLCREYQRLIYLSSTKEEMFKMKAHKI